MNNQVVQRCGIRLNPPALIAIYEERHKIGKLKKRVMPIRSFRVNSNVKFMSEDLKCRHSILESVPNITIEKMLRILQEHLRGKSLNEALDTVQSEFEIDPDEDLNKLPTTDVQRKKEIMEETFLKNRILPDDPDFIYDKQIDFEIDHDKVESAWDKEETDDFWN